MPQYFLYPCRYILESFLITAANQMDVLYNFNEKIQFTRQEFDEQCFIILWLVICVHLGKSLSFVILTFLRQAQGKRRDNV